MVGEYHDETGPVDLQEMLGYLNFSSGSPTR